MRSSSRSMETSGAVVVNRVLFLPCAAFELNRQQKRGLIGCVNVRSKNLNLCVKPNPMRFFGSTFLDDRELARSRSMIRCGVKKERKLRKKLEKRLERFAGMGFGIDPKKGLVAEVETNMVTEASGVLLKQLHYLRAAEKGSKSKKKHKTKKKLMHDVYGGSLSSSSDSNEFQEVDDVAESWKGQGLSCSGISVADAIRQALERSLEHVDEPTSSIKSEDKEQCGCAKVSEMRDVVTSILIQWILMWFAAGWWSHRSGSSTNKHTSESREED